MFLATGWIDKGGVGELVGLKEDSRESVSILLVSPNKKSQLPEIQTVGFLLWFDIYACSYLATTIFKVMEYPVSSLKFSK